MLKSSKFWTTVVGTLVSVGTFVGLKAIGVDEDSARNVSLAIAGLFGITISASALINVVAIWKGLEKPK